MIMNLFQLVGALGIFLFGMHLMTEGLQRTAGDKLQQILNHLTGNVFKGIFTGFFITILVQSSSVTTVMTIGFVNAGLLNLVQSIGVILGANIGTTVTSWIVSLFGFKFKIIHYIWPLLSVAVFLYFNKKEKFSAIGQFLLGFSFLFMGLDFITDAMPNVDAAMLHLLAPYTDLGFISILLFVIVGVILTTILHSSSASTTLVLTLAHTGVITYPLAVAMVLGSNIGTTIDALLASINGTCIAKRAAYVHLLFNVIGSVLAVILFYPFLAFIDLITPANVDITFKLAITHTAFNVINTIIFLPFIKQLANLVTRIVPDDALEENHDYSIPFVESAHQESPQLSLINVRGEISHMSQVVKDMFQDVMEVLRSDNEDRSERINNIKNNENYTDQMEEKLVHYLSETTRMTTTEKQALQISSYMRVLNEFEHLGDSCMSIAMSAKRRYEKDIPLHDGSRKQLLKYSQLVEDYLGFIAINKNLSMNQDDLKKAYQFEEEINAKRNELKKIARHAIQDGADVKGALLFIDIVRHLENMGDYCLNIVQALHREAN